MQFWNEIRDTIVAMHQAHDPALLLGFYGIIVAVIGCINSGHKRERERSGRALSNCLELCSV